MAANDQIATSWWRLDELAGPDAIDLRARNHGTYQGGITRGAGGATFDGSTGYVTVPDSGTLDAAVADSWWIAARVTRGALGANRTIMSKGSNGWNLRLDTTGKPQLVKSNVGVLVQAPAAIDTNPHVIAATKSIGSLLLKLYVDGVLVASATPAAGAMPVATDLPLTIGCDSFSASGRQEFWNGVIHGVGVSATPLLTPIVEPVAYGTPPPGYLPMPAFGGTWRDPAAASSTTVPVQLDVICLHGGSAQSGNVSVSVQSPTDGAFYANGVGVPVVAGVASLVLNVRYLDVGKTLTCTINANATSWTLGLAAAFGIARGVNIDLGDNATALTASVAMLATNKPPDECTVWYRAMTGPGLTDYAPASVWTMTLATAAAQLPTTGAWLAVQYQLVRRNA